MRLVLEVRVSDNYGPPPVQGFNVEVDYLPVTLHDPIRLTVTSASPHG